MASVTKEYNLKVNTKGAEANVDSLNEGLEQTQADLGGIENAGDQMTGGMISGFKGVLTSVKGAITGLKTMKGAIIATGIGALVIAVTSLAAAFTNTEEGQNKLNKIMGIMGSVTGNLIDILANLGDKLIWVFTSPREALTSFVELIKSQIINRFNAAIDTVGFLGSAIKKVFEGDFSGAMDAAKSAGSSYVDVLTGVENSIERATQGVKGFVKEIVEEGKIAGEIADKRAKADKVDRQLQIDRAIANRERADLLDKAVQKDAFTAKERIAFLEEAGRLEEEITLKEIAAAKLRYDAKVAENALAGSTKEDLDEEIALKAQLIDLETAKLTKAKLVTTQIFAANAQVKAEEKAIKDKEIADQKVQDDADIAAVKKLGDLKNAIRTAAAVSEDEKRVLEIEKTIEHYDALIELAKANGLAFEQLEKAKADKLTHIRGKGAQETAEVEVKWADMSGKQKTQIAGATLNNLATILGTETAAGKAAAIGAATISTFQSAVDSYKSLAGIQIVGPVLGAIAAAAAIVSGIANVKRITQTKTPTVAGVKAGPSVSGGAMPTPPPPPAPPSLDSVASSGFDQLADAIGESVSEPVQAYVVSNDVTTAQSLERNIVDGAAIG